MLKNIVQSFLCWVLFFLLPVYLYAQIPADSLQKIEAKLILITAIKISGNKHTKGYIIEREMPFKAGDYLRNDSLQAIFKQTRIQIYNTNLFIEVKVDSLILRDASLQVNVLVKERWYIFPAPQFALVDRSYKEWIKTFNADLNRVVYGLNFTHYNFSGRRDQLSMTLLNGYARNLSFAYSAPYSNSKLTEGFGVSASYTQNREIGFNTSINNKPMVFPLLDSGETFRPNFVRDNYELDMNYSRQKGFFKRSAISFGLNYLVVNDSITDKKYNPNYFGNNNTKQFYTDITLGVSYINTDKNAYPLQGLAYNYGISKRGFGFAGGINNTTLFGTVAKFITHPHHFYSKIKASGILKIPFNQAYINQRAIGFGNLKLRGLELYIIDGVAAATTNYTFSKKIVSFRIPIPFKIKAVPYIPFTFFAKTYVDIGYSYIPQQYNRRLNNKFLYTGGFGIDILSLYDLVFKIEYSFNQLGEKGLFLQGGGGF